MEYSEQELQEAYDCAFDGMIDNEGLWTYDGTYDILSEGRE